MSTATCLSMPERTARVRGLAGAARPRITYRMLAADAGLAHSTVRQILSDGVDWNAEDAMERIERALDARLTAAAEVPS